MIHIPAVFSQRIKELLANPQLDININGGKSLTTLHSLEVEAAVLPLELRREGLSIREGDKTMSKDNSQAIKLMWNEWRDDYRDKERHMSPFGLIDLRLQDMETHSGTNKRYKY